MRFTPISAEAANAGAEAYKLQLAWLDMLEAIEHVQPGPAIEAAIGMMDEARVAYEDYLSLLPRRH